jgi:hypothetical protein
MLANCTVRKNYVNLSLGKAAVGAQNACTSASPRTTWDEPLTSWPAPLASPPPYHPADAYVGGALGVGLLSFLLSLVLHEDWA